MRTVCLLRHAKSDWSGSLPDHERPLAGRGRKAAVRMGAHIAALGVRPGHVLCSSSRRTQETLEGLRPFLAGEPGVSIEEEIYLAEASSLLARIRRLDDATETILLIGHNPGVGDLAHTLVGDGDADAVARMRAKFPTAALAVIAFDAPSWTAVAPAGGRLIEFTRPRDLE